MQFFVFLLAAGLVIMVLKVAVFVAVIAGIIYAIFNPRKAAFWIFLCCIFALYEKYLSTAEQKSAIRRRKTRPRCYMPGGVA